MTNLTECRRCGCHAPYEELRFYPQYTFFPLLCIDCFGDLEKMSPEEKYGKDRGKVIRNLSDPSQPSMKECALEHERLKALLDDRGVYVDDGDNLYIRVAQLWDDWLIEFRKARGLPVTPDDARAALHEPPFSGAEG